jgi:hypothetical protein
MGAPQSAENDLCDPITTARTDAQYGEKIEEKLKRPLA